MDRLGRHIGTLVFDISYKHVVQVVVGHQSMQTCHCHDDILQQGNINFAIIPLGVTTDWSLKACTLLCPLYTTLCISYGLKIGRTVPSIKPQQLCRGATFAWILSSHVCMFSHRNVNAVHELFRNSNKIRTNMRRFFEKDIIFSSPK